MSALVSAAIIIVIVTKLANSLGEGIDRANRDRDGTIVLLQRSEEQLQQTLGSLRKAVHTTIQVMISALEVRDPYTAGHHMRSARGLKLAG